ncbi:hypothetical protein Glove_401g17 [Diversispora epigaea]|uniref:Uncharacterized protein n=1 Tax=Diversispora epigaea TaxID=1348612 RepID=A0A397H7W3_9GLOM|nr:hypothetical protein Glove_401g17 [Diversispora epigaea]
MSIMLSLGRDSPYPSRAVVLEVLSRLYVKTHENDSKPMRIFRWAIDIVEKLDELPINTINEFKQIIVTEIHRKLTPSFRSMGKKTLTIPCTESSNSYEILSSIFNSEQWGKKIYSQNQVTYIVCADPIPWNNNLQNQSIEEIDPLEKLLQSSIKKKIIKRRPRFLRGEILIEWKKKTFKEINGNINKAGYLHINFYISQSQIF